MLVVAIIVQWRCYVQSSDVYDWLQAVMVDDHVCPTKDATVEGGGERGMPIQCTELMIINSVKLKELLSYLTSS